MFGFMATAFLSLLRKEIHRFLRLWTQTLLPSVITTTLYFLIFGQLIGARIGEFSGTPYIAYIAPGLIMMAIINNSYNNVVSSFYSARFNHSVEELLISPMSDAMILWGYVIGGVLRGFIVALLVAGVAFYFVDLKIAHPIIMLLMLFLTSLVFSLAGFINACYARSFDDAALVPTFILTPLIYLGGVFYSIDLLPEFWKNLSQINPILYIVNGFRYGILGISDVSVYLAFLFLIIFLFILYIWALKLMQSAGKLRK